MVVVAVVTPDPRKLQLQIRRLRRHLALKAKSDLHAASSPPELVKKLLMTLRDDPFISIIAVAWEGERDDIQDHDRLYQMLLARCAECTVRQNRRVNLHIDKRYTKKHSRGIAWVMRVE